MRDKDLYEGILGLEPPWRVVNVVLDTGGREVRVEGIVPGSETLIYKLDSDDAQTRVPLLAQGGGRYAATLPGADCTSPLFYFEAEATGGSIVTLPRDAAGVS